MVEEVIQETADRRVRTTLTGQKMQPTKIADVVPKKEPRVQTKLAELNRVLGGGVVPGSLILIGGDPGIGKSTLLLQVSQQLAAIGGTVLYVSGEESAEQIKMRAQRLGAIDTEFYLYGETDMSEISKAIENIRPDYVIIDSIQYHLRGWLCQPRARNDRRIAENRQNQWHRHLYRWPRDEGRLDRRTADAGAYGGYRLVFRRRKAP